MTVEVEMYLDGEREPDDDARLVVSDGDGGEWDTAVCHPLPEHLVDEFGDEILSAPETGGSS